MRTHLSLAGISQLVEGTLKNPAELLGPHRIVQQDREAVSVRAFLPRSKQVWLVDERHQCVRPMRRVHPSGFYEAICPVESTSHYRFRIAQENGDITEMHDPYNVKPLLTDFDLYLFGEGRNWRLYEKLGAHPRVVDGVPGVNFAVWAPNAESVQVIGDFNQWNGTQHPMRKHIPSGVWELFIPRAKIGEKYKFRVRRVGGQTVDKSDPFGFYSELPPRTASVVADLDTYTWNDAEWMESRPARDAFSQPISIYEVHLGSWKRDPEGHHGWMNYRKAAHELVDYCKQMGFTHIELLPISEHPFTGSWGYQTVGYYAVTSRYGTPQDFMYFVDYCHQNGIGVIIDWVPAHFPKDDHGLRQFDGTALYEHADPRQGEHPDWGTMIFNYGRNEVRNFLVANALFWLDKYHIDGLRVDAVASMLYLDYSRQDGQWIPNAYGGRENLEAIHMLREFNEQAHGQFPGIMTVAEESTAWPGVSRPTYTGGLGFSMKWNMGWMNDTLRYMRHEPIHRKYHHDELTFSLIYAFTENFVLPFSHDEVVHGKGSLISQMAGDLWQKFANLRLLYSYMWTHPGKKLLFMGCEIAQWHEWDYDSQIQWELLDWDTHRGVQKVVADLNALIGREPALHEVDFEGEGFEWVDCLNREDSVLVYLRKARDPEDFVVVACNFTPVVRHGYRIGVPRPGKYREIFNSDLSLYGGSNVGNFAGCEATLAPHHGRPASMPVDLPPLATIVLKPE
ncbi:MAG: 1,4-alpha-glucan branching protein GlgB [Planctomycetota bacterium]|nr:MAG: 1,4-alpha-glucan branching protein GlgB [Planctomycetota bacterium]